MNQVNGIVASEIARAAAKKAQAAEAAGPPPWMLDIERLFGVFVAEKYDDYHRIRRDHGTYLWRHVPLDGLLSEQLYPLSELPDITFAYWLMPYLQEWCDLKNEEADQAGVPLSYVWMMQFMAWDPATAPIRMPEWLVSAGYIDPRIRALSKQDADAGCTLVPTGLLHPVSNCQSSKPGIALAGTLVRLCDWDYLGVHRELFPHRYEPQWPKIITEI